MAPSTALLPHHDQGVFAPARADELAVFFRAQGYAVLRGALTPAALQQIRHECDAAQAALLGGLLDPRHGTTALVDDPGGARTATFANYVTHLGELAPGVLALLDQPVVRGLISGWLGPRHWLMTGTAGGAFGIVHQDARPGRESSYTRIGWHSDWQSAPHRPRQWPGVAFTLHLDATSPANGFLRVVPGSHAWATPAPFRNANGAVVPEGAEPVGGHGHEPPPVAMPLGFAKVPGEVAVYCEEGDLLFHDAYLWHSAARATDDEAVRRHVRGGWYSGEPADAAQLDDFVKNAAR